MRILVVDDDEILVDVLQQSLNSKRHVVDIAEDGQIAWEYVQTGEYQLVLLDVNLPRLDGVSLCEKMRTEGYTTPILLMTAKNETQDRIQGLDAGADDYLTKPLDLEELNARIRALSRRGEVAPTTKLDINGLILNPVSCEVHYQQQPIKLTAKEYNLLELFLRNPTRVFSRAQILDKIWTFDDPPLEDSVKAHIKGLRKKLKKAGVVNWIENVYGIGYRLNPQTEETPAKQSQNKPQNKPPHTTSIEQQFDRKLEQMWLKYQDKMLERMQILQNAVSAIPKASLSADMQTEAKKAAHKLAGVLGMFSRDTGTEIAREIETLLEHNPDLDTLQQDKFISLVKDLDSLLGLDATLAADKTTDNAQLLLISTDSQFSRELSQITKTQGIREHHLANISQAKQWLKSNSPYIVIIDIATVTSSTEYLTLIQELTARTPAIPTLVISDLDRLEHRVDIVRAGAKGFLVKPTPPTVVWETVQNLIQQNQATIPSILVVDDDLVFLDALRSLLEPWGIRVTTLEQPTQFWEVLTKCQPDLLILDIEMPQISGFELCQTLRSDRNWQDLPILFLTAKQDSTTIQQVFELGGDDYIPKPVVGAALIARINNRLERNRLLKSLVAQDPLTGLKNRNQSSREIEALLPQYAASQEPFSLAMLKITDLEQINFQHGHQIGDRILTQWGKILQAALRGEEIVGYWGNGNFAIAMPHLNQTQSQEHLQEVITILRTKVFTSSAEDRFQVAFNCSIAELTPDKITLHSLYQACI